MYIPIIIIKFFYKIIRFLCRIFRVSFSFSADGEDLALRKYFDGISEGFYIDIGSNHPIKHSNTFYFYLNGWRGICIDPLPLLQSSYKAFRNEDLFINAGYAGSNAKNNSLSFYYYEKFPDNSTFNLERVNKLKELFDRDPSSIIEVPLININNLISSIEKKFINFESIKLLNLDTEGFEFEILKSFFDNGLYPWVICVEDLECKLETLASQKIYQLMRANDYVLGVRTYLTSIYISKNSISKLPSLFVKESAVIS